MLIIIHYLKVATLILTHKVAAKWMLLSLQLLMEISVKTIEVRLQIVYYYSFAGPPIGYFEV